MYVHCRVVALVLVLLTPHASATTISAPYTCESFNRQTRVSGQRLDGELHIANGPLSAADLAAGRNPKLKAYLDQFASDVLVHGLQGRPEPAHLEDVRAHYRFVMGRATPTVRDADGALQEDLRVVAGPMAAHRYHASLHVPGFPPDFAYYDAALPLRLRGQTVFDYGGSGGTIRERWSNHDNRFRTGQLWRYMLGHPRTEDPLQFRTDLRDGSDAPGATMDRDGERLNAVFNGELALQPGDFTLLGGAFHYGPATRPAETERPVTETEGLQFVRRWFTGPEVALKAESGPGWLADDATIHGAGCDLVSAANAAASAGGPASGRRAAQTLRSVLVDRLGPDIRQRLLSATDAAAAYGQLPVSAWSRVAFRSEFSGTRTVADGPGGKRAVPVRYCAQWIMRLHAEPPTEPRAQEVWLDLTRLADPAARCNDRSTGAVFEEKEPD